MDNQQELKSNYKEAWLAGMFNGDGCFSLTFRQRKGILKCDLSLTITQTDPSIIEEVSNILNKQLNINPSIQTYVPTGAGKKEKYNLRINKMSQILSVIDLILPHMIGNKRAQASLMKRYIERRIIYADPSLRRQNKIIDDPVSIQVGLDFYKQRGSDLPKDLKFLNDYS